MNISEVAIVQLCYADFESLEISLAAFTKFMPKDARFFILQNGRGTYDCERTYEVAKRYHDLFPKNITVVDWIKPQQPYYAIKELLNSPIMSPFKYVCKVDDDVFPLTETWLQDLMVCYEQAEEKYGENLGYVTSLVNNNPWGFIETLKIMDLEKFYFDNLARDHIIRDDEIASANEIKDGYCGTIWRNPHISRWLHHSTTLNADNYINRTKELDDKLVNNKERYSINCMLFEKQFWNKIDIDHSDDEHQCFVYCLEQDKRIVSCRKVPMVHLFFKVQRNENKDLLPVIRDYYTKWLNLSFPISMCPMKEYENENRLRFMEKLLTSHKQHHNKMFSIYSASDNRHKIVNVLGLKLKIKTKKKK